MNIEELQTKLQELETLVASAKDYAQAEVQALELLDNLPHLRVELEQLEQLKVIEARVLVALCDSLWPHGMARKAVPYAEQALALAQNVKDLVLKARIYNMEGNVYANHPDYPEALEYYGKALASYEKIGDKSGIATTLSNIGFVHSRLSDYPTAIQHLSKSIAIHEELNNKREAAKINNNIGNVYLALSDYQRALEYFNKAYQANEDIGDKNIQATAVGNIGSVYTRLADFSRGLEYYGKALSAHEELGNKGKVAAITSNIGAIYANLLDYPKALEYYEKALATLEQIGGKSDTAVIIGNIGNLFARDDFDGYDAIKAEEYLLKAIALSGEIGAKSSMYKSHNDLAELYEKTDRKSEAFDHFKKYHDLEKEVLSEEAKKQADRLDFERKTAEREKQLAVERATAAARIEEQQKLIHNVLPPIIAERLLNNETFIADSYPNVSVLFMDLVNFTRIAAIIPPRHLIYLLNTIFSNADAVMEKHGLEKIKTIGDAYMAVAGAPVHQEDHAQRAALAAIDIIEAMNNLSVSIPAELGDTTWIQQVDEIQVRIGLHCGEAIGGVIGDKKFTFDLWGDAVNTASRMESHGEAGRIHVSEEFAKNLTLRQAQYTAQTNLTQTLSQGEGFSFPLGEGRDGVLIPRGEIDIKGKGIMRTYFLERR
jgi:class 3 adenylate cyclase/predicted negative regulator of RcsB-dependent stress response